MSIALMSIVWDQSGLTGSELLVMLALADHANDDGECWPSMARVAERARITGRGARRIIARLEERGLVSREISRGRGHSNFYRLALKADLETRNESPVLAVKPDPSDTKPDPGDIKPDPPVRQNHQEPSRNRQSEDAREARSVLSAVLGEELAGEFSRYRMRMRKPLSPTGARRLVATLRKIEETQGAPPADVVAEIMDRGWQSVKPDWIKPNPDKQQPFDWKRIWAEGQQQ